MSLNIQESNKNRLIFLYVCIIIAFILIALRLVFVVLAGDKVVVNNLYDPGSIIRRGDIIDRNGVIVATDLKTKSLYIDSVLVKDPKSLVTKLVSVLPELNYKETLHKILNKKDRSWILIKRNTTPSQQEAIQNLKMAGLLFEDDLVRIYPQKSILSHIVGYVDLDRNGLAGVEMEYDKMLKAGKKNLQLAMDVRIQDILNDELNNGIEKYNALGAAGIVMNVNNGEVLAVSSLPNFDPNIQSEAENNQRFNRATYGVYELGSIFKIFTNAIAFDNNLVKTNDVYNVKNPIEYGRFTIRDDHYVKDEMTVEEIFAYSSNIGTVQIAKKIGEDLQKEYLKKFGLLDKLSSDFPALGRPIYPKKWREINLYTIAYGHGIAITPLHIASAVSAIVNGGTLYNPSFAKLSSIPSGTSVIKESTSETMRRIMRKVVVEGTGKNANIEGYEVGGKTGTAERAEFGGYNERKTMTSFVAVFPVSQPEYLVYVVIDRPNSMFNTGGMVAAPVAGAIVKNIAPILGIVPNIETHIEADGSAISVKQADHH